MVSTVQAQKIRELFEARETAQTPQERMKIQKAIDEAAHGRESESYVKTTKTETGEVKTEYGKGYAYRKYGGNIGYVTPEQIAEYEAEQKKEEIPVVSEVTEEIIEDRGEPTPEFLEKLKASGEIGIFDPTKVQETIAPTKPAIPWVAEPTPDIMERPDVRKQMYLPTTRFETITSIPGISDESAKRKERREEMDLEKKHYLGRDAEGNPVYATITSGKYYYGYNPSVHDPKQVKAYQKAETGGEKNLEIASANLEMAEEAIAQKPEIIEFIGELESAPAGTAVSYKELLPADTDPSVILKYQREGYEVSPTIEGYYEVLHENESVEKALPFFKSRLKELENIEKDYPTYVKSKKDIVQQLNIVEGYKERGWKIKETDKGYEFEDPEASTVLKFIGKAGVERYIGEGLRGVAIGDFGAVGAAVQSIVTGSKEPALDEFEHMSESLLYHTQRPTESQLEYTTRFWSSPRTVSTIYVPLATYGIAKGVSLGFSTVSPYVLGGVSGVSATFTNLVGRVSPYVPAIIKEAAKKYVIPGVVGGAKLATKAVSMPGSKYVAKYSLFLGLEGQPLIETGLQRPETFGAEFTRRLGGWEAQWAWMEYGFKGTKITREKPTEWKTLAKEEGKYRFKTEQYVSGDLPITMRELDVGKKYKTYEWWVGGKQYVTDIKGTKGIITRPYDVSAHGKLFTVTDDVYVLHPSLDPTKEFFEVVPKGTTFSYGTGVVRDPITGQLVKRSTTKVFKTIGVGREIPVPGLIDPEGVVPHLFKAKGYVKTTLPTQVTPSRGIGIFQTGREGEVILTEFARKQYVTGKWSTINKIRNVGLFDKSITTKELLRLTPDEYAYATWQTSKAPKSLGVPSDIGQVDFTKTISLKYKATGGEYLFVGEYPAKGFDVGKIKLTGRISVITGKPTEKVITKAIEKEQLLWTDQAVGTLVRPATTGEKVIVESILPSIAEEVGAVASLAPPTIVYAPSAKAVVEKVGVSPLLIFTGRPKTITEREKPAFITGLKTEQELRQEMISIVGMKTKTLLDQRQKQDLIAKPMVTTITGTTEIEKQEEIDIVTPIQDVGLDLGQQQRQEQLLKLAQKQKSMLKLDTLTVTTQVTTTTPPSIVTVPKIPWLVLPEDEKAAKPLLKEKEPVGKGFNVYVKERSMYGRKIVKPTKFKKVNVHSLTKRDALSLGATIADESAAISFKIKPTDKKPKKSLLPTKSFESIGHKFKKKGEVYIEKTKYRIDTPGEIKEISARGWLSNKRKAMTKKDLVGGKVDRLIGTKNSTKRKKNVRYI